MDLLFAIRPDSEPLHQLALGALLRHSPLLQRLGVLDPAASLPLPLGDHQWEPLGDTFELALRLPDRSQLLVVIKIDGTLSDDQLRRQLQELRAEGRAGDRLLYLLLGYSAITVGPRIARLAQEVSLPAARWSVRGAAEVARVLGSPALLWGAGSHGAARDARDLAVVYRDHLLALQGRVEGFFQRPLAAWSEGDYLGFFALCRQRVPLLADASIDLPAGTTGGTVSCAWGAHALAPGVELHLQFEGARLCVKLRVEAQERRGPLRDLACAQLLRINPAASSQPSQPLQIVRPARLGHGRLMTIGYLEGAPFGDEERFPAFAQALQAASDIVAAAAQRLGADLAR